MNLRRTRNSILQCKHWIDIQKNVGDIICGVVSIRTTEEVNAVRV